MREEIERLKVDHFKLKFQYDYSKLCLKEVTENDIHDIQRRIEDLMEQNKQKKKTNESYEKQLNDLKNDMQNSLLRLKDTINNSGNVDDKIIPKVENHIGVTNKIKNELHNIRRNTENLPKIIKQDKNLRDYIKIEKNIAQNTLNKTIDIHKDEIQRINKARELNIKKNLITDIAVNQRYEFQKEFQSLKEKLALLTEEKNARMTLYAAKMKKRSKKMLEMDILEEENMKINDEN